MIAYFFVAIWFALFALLLLHNRRIRRQGMRSVHLYSRAIQRAGGYLQIDLDRW